MTTAVFEMLRQNAPTAPAAVRGRAAVRPTASAVDAGRAQRGRVVLSALAVIAIAFGLRCAFLAVLYDGDTELFVYMGKLVAGGGVMGVDIVDNKLPTVGLLMTVPWRVFGPSWLGYALMSIGLAAGTVIALARTARTIDERGTWPVAAIAAVWVCFPLAVFSAFKLEHVTIFFASLAGLAAVNVWKKQDWRDAFLLGLAAGTGALAKPSCLAVAAAACIALLFWRHVTWKKKFLLAGAATLGVLIPAGVCASYFFATDSFGAVRQLARQTSLYTKNSVWQTHVFAWKVASVALVFGLPMAMRWWMERRNRIVSPPDDVKTFRWHAPSLGGLWLFAGAWFALDCAAIILQGRMYAYHFLPLAVPAAVGYALLRRKPSSLAIIGTAVPVLLLSVEWTRTAVLDTPVPTERLAVIQWLKTHANDNDAAWMDDDGRLLAETNLKPATRVPLTFIFSNHDEAPLEFSRVMLADFEARQPRWLVLRPKQADVVFTLQHTLAEYAKRPRRGENLARAWASIADYVGPRYVERAKCGELSIYERK